MLQGTAQTLVDVVVAVCSDYLFPIMFVGFGVSLFCKLLIVATVKRHAWFIKEFEKRTVHFLEKKELQRGGSFYVSTKRLLEKTYYELFEIRGIMMRRKLDYITSPLDRLFAIQQGCALLVRDTLQEIRFLHRENSNPNMIDIGKSTNSRNPCFGKVFGWISLGPLNDVVNLVPGLFIIAGIFGTFLGIMEALPELSNLDLKDPEGSKIIMDTFLLKISFSISTSIVGIIFSVILTIIHSVLAPEKLYVKIVDVYSRCLTRLWELSDSNEIPSEVKDFDEHKDPLVALAELAMEKGIQEAALKHDEKEEIDHRRHLPLPTAPAEETKKAS